MPDPVVNASPLIILAKAGMLNLLQLAGPEIVVPQPVMLELSAHHNDAGALAVPNTPWLKIVDVTVIPSWIAAWDLGAVESAVLAWAHSHPGTVAILDDLAARRCAASGAIEFRGTLGLALLAKQRGVIPLARPAIEQMRKAGLYLSDKVVDNALSLVGE